MKFKKTALLLFTAVLIALFSVSAEACDFTGDEKYSGMDSFLPVLNAWGGFLAKASGAYGILESISKISGFTEILKNLTETGYSSPEEFFKALLQWLGMNMIIIQDEELPPGSYSL